MFTVFQHIHSDFFCESVYLREVGEKKKRMLIINLNILTDWRLWGERPFSLLNFPLPVIIVNRSLNSPTLTKNACFVITKIEL